MSLKKSILLIIDTHLSWAPRAQTMVRALKSEYDVTVAAFGPDTENGYQFEELKTCKEKRNDFHFGYSWPIRKSVSASLILWDKFTSLFPHYYYEHQIWNLTNKARLQQFNGKKFDAVICHHAHNLPVAARIAGQMKVPLLFNAHEYYPREFENNAMWVKSRKPFIDYICKTYLKNVSKCFAAASGYAAAYAENFNVDCTTIPCVKPFYNGQPKNPNNKIRIVHQGYANADRKIETMIRMCDFLDERFELHLFLMPTDPVYFDEIKAMVEKRPNAFLVAPTRPEDLLKTLNDYDIGLYILEPTNFNTKHMLPNKLFEFVQARLMVAISPALGMTPFVEKHSLGIISKDHTAESMAEQLNALRNEDIITFKQNADKAANDMAAESYYPVIRNEVSKYLV